MASLPWESVLPNDRDDLGSDAVGDAQVDDWESGVRAKGVGGDTGLRRNW
jgi:hypothetical protein